MSTAVTHKLTLAEFLSEYGAESGYEYWFGEVVRKGMGTKWHSLLQRVLEDLLRRAGYDAASEVDLCVDPNWRPRPDVMADPVIEHPYPVRPVAIVAEVLSPDDRMSRVFQKCRHYVRIGIPQILVFDPETLDAWQWDRSTDNLERIREIRMANGSILSVETVWQEFDLRLKNPQ